MSPLLAIAQLPACSATRFHGRLGAGFGYADRERNVRLDWGMVADTSLYPGTIAAQSA